MMYRIGALVALFALYGCASPIEQPTAQRPLVNPTEHGPLKSVPSMHWDMLNSAEAGSVLTLSAQTLAMGKSYASAKGNTCRKLVRQGSAGAIPTSGHSSLVVCKSLTRDGWHFANSVLADAPEEQGSGE